MVVKIRYFNKYGKFKSTPSESVTTNEMIVWEQALGENLSSLCSALGGNVSVLRTDKGYHQKSKSAPKWSLILKLARLFLHLSNRDAEAGGRGKGGGGGGGGEYGHCCSQQCRSMWRKASWRESPGGAPCLRVSIFPWLLFFMTSLVPSNRGDYWPSALFPVAQSPDTVQEKGAERWKELGKHLSLILHPKVHSYFLPLCNPPCTEWRSLFSALIILWSWVMFWLLFEHDSFLDADSWQQVLVSFILDSAASGTN